MDGIFGLCVGDALGVPAEFKSREELMADPVVDMRSYGSHRQPAGTWSDDTSLTLCLIDSLAQGLDYNDIMIKFLSWLETGAYSPFGDAFDVGNGTEEAQRQRHLATFQHTEQQVAPKIVGAEGMDRQQVDRRRQILEIRILRRKWHQMGNDKAGEDDQGEDEETHHRQAILAEPVQ